jgi:hypothetical protein
MRFDLVTFSRHLRPFSGIESLRFGAVLAALACVMAVLSVWLTGTSYY